MKIQIWSYNYDPEPQGIAPLTTALARELRQRSHSVTVLAAHPHYPEPVWGSRRRPYREVRDGVTVLRLPIWVGRQSTKERVRQELSFNAAQTAVAPLLPSADVVLSVTPSMPALLPAMAFTSMRRVPWVIWVQDIVTDGALSTGQLEEGRALRAARRFEVHAYQSASRILVISDAFRIRLVAMGVDRTKIAKVFNPFTRQADTPNDLDALSATPPPQILVMGNIGYSQGLDRIVDAFEADRRLEQLGARLVVAGTGAAAQSMRERIKGDRVDVLGVLHGDELLPVLRSASIGLVSQRSEILEFNLPSKLMNYMAFGIPVIASVNVSSETATIIRRSGAGWVTDAAEPAEFATLAGQVLGDPDALRTAGRAGFAFAQSEFSPAAVADQVEAVLHQAVLDSMSGRKTS